MSKLYEIVKNDNSQIFKILNLVAKFGIKNIEDIEKFYENTKFMDAKILKTYDDWNKLGYVIKKGEKGIKIYKGKNSISSHFDISQVLGNEKSVEIYENKLNNPLILLEEHTKNKEIYNILNSIKSSLNDDYSFFQKVIIDNLTIFAILDKYDYYAQSKITNLDNEKSSILSLLKETKTEFIENEAKFDKILNKIIDLTNSSILGIFAEGQKNNLLKRQIVDKNQNFYYTINNIENQEKNLSIGGNSYDETILETNKGRTKEDEWKRVIEGVANSGNEDNRDDIQDVGIERSNNNRPNELHNKGERILQASREIQDDRRDTELLRSGSMEYVTDILSDSKNRYIRTRQEETREDRTNNRRDNSSSSESILYENDTNSEWTQTNRQNTEFQRRNDNANVEGRTGVAGAKRDDPTAKQVENDTDIHKKIREYDGNSSSERSENDDGTKSENGEPSSTENNNEQYDTRHNVYADSGIEDSKNTNNINGAGDKTPAFSFDAKNTIEIDKDNFYAINREDNNGVALGIDKNKLLEFFKENDKVFKANRKQEQLKNQTIVCHIFNPYGVGDWLITDYVKDKDDIYLTGWCNLGNDTFAEYGETSLNELLNANKRFPIEVETHGFTFGERFIDKVKNNRTSYGLDNIVNNNDVLNIDNTNKFNIKFKENEEIENQVKEQNKQENSKNIEIKQNNKEELLKLDFVNNKIEIDNSFKKAEKFNDNINAIKTLKKVESENRQATKEEQEIMAKYVGWGGLAAFAFDKVRGKKENYDLVKDLLTEKEYNDARKSALSAYYTPDYVVKEIWEKVKDFGFKGGKILEPSCGTGKFLSNMPKDIRENSDVVGIELDNISARISKLLYPSMIIKNKGFEEEKIANNTYNLVIGNVPFGDFKVNDKEYNKDNLLIHDYFINKSLDKLADGGICTLITTTGTLDKFNDSARVLFSEKANFIGSIRLPNGTFGDTEAGTDILFFQKNQNEKLGINQEFVNTDSYYNPAKDQLRYENRIYINSKNNERYNLNESRSIDRFISREMFEDLFLGIKYNDLSEEITIDDFDSWGELYYDLNKITELKEKYNKWVENGKKEEEKPYNKNKDLYVVKRRDVINNETIKELKTINRYEVLVGKENPNFISEVVNKKGETKLQKNKDEKQYKFDVTNYHIESRDDLYENRKSERKGFLNININQYYKNNPNQVIGTFRTDTGEGGRPIIKTILNSDNDILKELKNKLSNINCKYWQQENTKEEESEKEEGVKYIPEDEYENSRLYNVKKWTHFIHNGNLCFKEDDRAYYVNYLSSQDENLLKSLVDINDNAIKILNLEMQNKVEEAKTEKENMLTRYNDFYSKFGKRINSDYVIKLLRNDDNKGLLLSLEVGNNETTESYKVKKTKSKINEEDISYTKVLNNGIEVSVVEDSKGKEHYYDNDNNEYIISEKEEFSFEKLAPIFTERVIQNEPEIKNVNNCNDGLIASLQVYGKVNIDYIKELTNKSTEDVLKELNDNIYYDIANEEYVTKDEFLSGNIYKKIDDIENYINSNKSELEFYNNELNNAEKENNEDKVLDYSKKIEEVSNKIALVEPYIGKLKEILPDKISYEEIGINLGASWLPVKYYNKFIQDRLNVKVAISENSEYGCSVIFKEKLNPPEFFIKNKSYETNSNTELQYGTKRKTSLEILENALNLRPTTVSDKIKDENGKDKYVLNVDETQEANACAEKLKNAFKEWKETALNDEEKKEIEEIYNRNFNCMVERKYNSEILTFPCMNNNINLYEHQKNAVARMIFGRNTGLAHCVGAGKTNVMIASIMKFKQLGLANKSMIVVPKPIIAQWEREFLNLYPTANILVPNEEDFTKENRRKFLNKIATGNYDAIILSQEQFQKIPLSKEREARYIEKDLKEYENYLNEILSEEDGIEANKRKQTIKSIESNIEKLRLNLAKLKNEEYKDNIIDFEQLGIDKLFVDEAHYYKNAFYPTKLNRIAGIQSKYTKRTYDLQLKCRYLNSKTNHKGVYLATGTPITNSIVETFTMMNYLQPDKLRESRLYNLDNFVSTFCSIIASYELDNIGVKYREKLRINSFSNATEVTKLFSECWDIVNVEDLKNIKLPEVERELIELKATEQQKAIMNTLIERQKRMENEKVDPHIDNPLKLTNDGKYLSVDPRIYDNNLPDEEGSKVNACVENVAKEYFDSLEKSGTQMIFSDLGVPKEGKSFDIYNDIKNKLIAKGIPEKEIAFIADYDKTPELKNQMQQMMKEGKIRVLLSSTNKGGTGLNVQDRMVAVHHLSIPWKPSDIDQREGRIIRQGNQNEKVRIYNYIQQGTFDARSYEILEQKSKMMKQILNKNSKQRFYGDECFKDDNEISYDEMVAMALPNSNIKKIKELERKIKLLEQQKNSFEFRIRDNKIKLKEIPVEIESAKKIRDYVIKDIEMVSKNADNDKFYIKIYGKNIGDVKEYDNRTAAGKMLYSRMFKDDTAIFNRTTLTKVAEYKGFEINVMYNIQKKAFQMRAKSLETGYLYYNKDLGDSEIGNLTIIDNFIKSFNNELKEKHDLKINNLEQEKENIKKSIENTFDENELIDAKEELEKLMSENEKQKEEFKEQSNKEQEPKLKA